LKRKRKNQALAILKTNGVRYKIGGTAVSTSTGNCGTTGTGNGPNCNQFVNNEVDDTIKVNTFMDGYTLPQIMTVPFPVGTHTIKVASVDADTVFDDDIDALDDAFVLMAFKSAVVTVPVPAPVPQMMGMMGMMAAR
jgi:hypothetical protein